MRVKDLPKHDRPAPPEVDAAGYALAEFLAIKTAKEDHFAAIAGHTQIKDCQIQSKDGFEPPN